MAGSVSPGAGGVGPIQGQYIASNWDITGRVFGFYNKLPAQLTDPSEVNIRAVQDQSSALAKDLGNAPGLVVPDYPGAHHLSRGIADFATTLGTLQFGRGGTLTVDGRTRLYQAAGTLYGNLLPAETRPTNVGFQYTKILYDGVPVDARAGVGRSLQALGEAGAQYMAEPSGPTYYRWNTANEQFGRALDVVGTYAPDAKPEIDAVRGAVNLTTVDPENRIEFANTAAQYYRGIGAVSEWSTRLTGEK